MKDIQKSVRHNRLHFFLQLSADDDDLNMDIVDMSLPARAAEQAEHLVRKVLEEAEQAEHLVRKVWEEAWKVSCFILLI